MFGPWYQNSGFIFNGRVISQSEELERKEVLATAIVAMKVFMGVRRLHIYDYSYWLYIGDREGENMCKNSVRNLATTFQRRLELIKEGDDGI